jgi:hypothetical protein
MMISVNTQLGLRFADHALKREFLELRLAWMESEIGELTETLDIVRNEKDFLSEPEAIAKIAQVKGISEDEARSDIQGFVMKHGVGRSALEGRSHESDLTEICEDKGWRHYLITQGVDKPSQMIRVGENFSATALQNLKPGNYSYLMGKHEMFRFMVDHPYIRGMYFNDLSKKTFEFYFDTNNGEHYLTNPEMNKDFTRITQLILFVELGDIEVCMIEGGKNNGKPKKDGKIHNGSNKTVYVVDSSWNKLIIRTDGFAVRGHFKLQPCGVGSRDRKLIWVDAFEKHGYTRRPRAEIVK